MRELTIGKNDAGQRLDRFLMKAVPLLPASLMQKYLRIKRIKVNGRRGDRDYRVAQGDVISLYINDEFFDKPTDDNAFLAVSTPRVDVVYEDENILLADKRPGMLCHSAGGEWSYNTLIAHIQAYLRARGEWDPYGENAFAPALCNRIDRNTGGIVIAAKNAEALRILNQKIKDREIQKYYLAAVHGTMRPREGRLEGFLFKDAKKNQVYITKTPRPGAKTAATLYRTLTERGGLSLVECELLTGRTHQIRAQFSAAGHPLLGDGKYGSERQNKPYGEKGQALYSYRLTFGFSTDGGLLNYLRGRSFSVGSVDFAKKYFDFDFSH